MAGRIDRIFKKILETKVARVAQANQPPQTKLKLLDFNARSLMTQTCGSFGWDSKDNSRLLISIRRLSLIVEESIWKSMGKDETKKIDQERFSNSER